MTPDLAKLDDPGRRRFLEAAAKSMLGVTILGAGAGPAWAQRGGKAKGGGKAQNCILLFMSGGMSHLDTFDPKPGAADVMGKTEVTKTNVNGEIISANLPQLAKHFDKLAVARSFNQRTGDHRQGVYKMRTSYTARPSILHPSMGPWAQKLLGKRHPQLPDSVTIGAGGDHPGRGFFDPSLSPLPIGNPDKGLQNSKPFEAWKRDAEEVKAEFDRRMDLMEKLDAGFREKYGHHHVQAYTAYYEETLQLLKSKDLKIFDLKEEPDAKRNRYGRTPFGQGCLLAKRLVKNGVRFVEVVKGGWDTHVDNFERVPELAMDFDRALSTLLDDLEAEGLLENTLVCVATEFGRSPIVNVNKGRDHHPGAFCGIFAGGGISGGQTFGKSDAKGVAVEKDPLTPEDYNATIAHALGIDITKVVYSPTDRPFTIATHHTQGKEIISDGQPILQFFS